MLDPHHAIALSLCFLSGSIPYGFLIPKYLKGINILERGSGNPGAANVLYEAGRLAGLLVLVLDSLKGGLPVYVIGILFPDSVLLQAACGGAAILAHCWTPFLHFKGGKAVATSMGVFFALVPLETGLTVAIFVVVVKLSGHISVGSMVGAAALPALILGTGRPNEFCILAAWAGLLILYRHIPNLKRLLANREID
ncbi:MAG: acyl-phosphate glycerol 3-phosphate acyltransferase [Elusimicrobia bacterium]|nr:MAG: acyl-phosphate glycerol 3-phosphate acyltransferase [Elusimicrobiota bacterium]